MAPRTQLQYLLQTLLGSTNVYFQPPASIQMKYPCIVYERTDIETMFANNYPYVSERRYKITVIDKDPDSPILDKVKNLPKCSFDRHYKADNLNHDVFNIFF